MPKFNVALVLLLASLSVMASESSQESGRITFQEVKSLADVPALIQQELGVSDPGLAGVADKGRPFNATDRLDGNLPRRRLLAAGFDGDLWLVALEHGGRGYNVQAYLFSGDGNLRKHKVLPGRPETIQAVLAHISVDPPRK